MAYRINKVSSKDINETLLEANRNYEEMLDLTNQYISYLSTDLALLQSQLSTIQSQIANVTYYNTLIDGIPETRSEMYERVKAAKAAYEEAEESFNTALEGYLSLDICAKANRIRATTIDIRNSSSQRIVITNKTSGVDYYSLSAPEFDNYLDNNTEIWNWGIYFEDDTYDNYVLTVDLNNSTAQIFAANGDDNNPYATIGWSYDVPWELFTRYQGNLVITRSTFIAWVDSICTEAHNSDEYKRATGAQEGLLDDYQEYEDLNDEYQEKYFPEEE